MLGISKKCGEQREREREMVNSMVPSLRITKGSANIYYVGLRIKRSLFLKTSIFVHLFPIFCSFLSDNKLFHHPFHYVWEFLTAWWCVWNSLLSIFYSQRELKKKKQNRLGVVVAVSNLVTTLLFTLTLLLKPKIIGKKPFWWWTYTSIWHYVAPIMSLTYFFKGAELERPLTQKKARRNKKFFISVILHPILFTTNNFVRKWILSSCGKEKFLGETEIGKKLRFKKFTVPWFNHVNQFINNIQKKEKIINNILLIILYFGATFFSFYLLAYLLVRIKLLFFNPQREKKGFETKKINHY